MFVKRERERGKVSVFVKRKRKWLIQVIKNLIFDKVGSNILLNLKYYCLILSRNKGL